MLPAAEPPSESWLVGCLGRTNVSRKIIGTLFIRMNYHRRGRWRRLRSRRFEVMIYGGKLTEKVTCQYEDGKNIAAMNGRIISPTTAAASPWPCTTLGEQCA